MSGLARVVTALESFPGQRHSWLVGAPCFSPPAQITAALAAAARASSFHYSPPAGFPALRDRLAQLSSGSAPGLTGANVVVTHGAKGGLLATLASVLAPGDEMIHPIPCYPAYPHMARALGACPIGVAHAPSSFAGWIDEVASSITSKTRLVLLSSPSNPSGATLDAVQQRQLLALCADNSLRLLCDEAYGAFCYADHSSWFPLEEDAELDTVISLRSASKTWALCGLRLGWVITNPALAEAIGHWQGATLNGPNCLSQKALIEAEEVPDSYLQEARTLVRHRLRQLYQLLQDLGLSLQLPDGGFYLWLDLRQQLESSRHASSLDWCCALARAQGVGLWPGEDYASPGWARLAAVSTPGNDWDSSLAELARRLHCYLDHS